jgi:hypothetical protein
MRKILVWRSGNKEITLDASRKWIVCTLLSDNPHESMETYVSFADFLSDSQLTSLYVHAYFSPEIYAELLEEVKKRAPVK